MRSETFYKCEYCGLRNRNKIKIAEHEQRCKTLSLEQTVAEQRLISLINYYKKLGYKVTVICRDDNDLLVSVHHRDYGKL